MASISSMREAAADNTSLRSTKSQLKKGEQAVLAGHRSTLVCVGGRGVGRGGLTVQKKNKYILRKDASERAFNFKAERRVLFLSW